MIEIRIPKTRDEFRAYYELRYRVLRQPWAQDRGTEKDDFEPISIHMMAWDTAVNKPVGVVKLYEKEAGVGCFSHLAIDPDYQRKGVGKILVDEVERKARELGYHKLGCFSRLNSTEYFERMGYKVAGLPSKYFLTTQVVWMEKTL
ncbi:MAG TPA: GNAT family N-acetyltransferase [Bellilinea sp.]|nr:GNAT family N-acetyltransferase [Bellilinea sp.]